jgi:shikimate kinase
MERQFILDGHPAAGCVVACGGGLPIQPGMRELLLSKGIVVCLFASEETILERTSRNNKRPILNVPDPAARVRQLLRERMPIYTSTGTGVSTENRAICDVVEHVVRVYRAESSRFLQGDFRPTEAADA